MSQAYRLSERAEADVEAIADFIAADNIDAAVQVVLALEEAFILLASRRDIGHGREELTDRRNRQRSLEPRIALRHGCESIVIVAPPGEGGLEGRGAGAVASYETLSVQREAACDQAVGRCGVGQVVEVLRRRLLALQECGAHAIVRMVPHGRDEVEQQGHGL